MSRRPAFEYGRHPEPPRHAESSTAHPGTCDSTPGVQNPPRVKSPPLVNEPDPVSLLPIVDLWYELEEHLQQESITRPDEIEEEVEAVQR
ncbi:uncharacterized protein BXZ73DRAFT_100500 [Epithele typhae]|uniref:uncharacterized protein n=1 Tax=Epithele typhae TaxID=378194 RepID=UPI0020073979|nr:uncharacterized protein BXZ73DRAFT_100500 [Epithele typhae]KAH9935108.1 hypothetical protein BXZ73DRAFT_100500 [Epithele typhae]